MQGASPSYPPVDPAGKGLGAFPPSCPPDQISSLNWSLLKEDVSLPVAVLYESRVQHNLDWMQEFMRAYKVQLAPHGKTTMSPALFHRQLKAGAWGITLATAPQVNAAYRYGIRRILMANQLIGRANMALIAQRLGDPAFEFCCLVDDPANIAQLGRYFADHGQGRTLRVLIELGVPGGRTGVRDDAALRRAVDEIARWPHSLALAGIELYEGVLSEENKIRDFLRRAVSTLRALQTHGNLTPTGTAILTGAGSAWFDVVAQEFSGLDIGRPLDIVLRPGCYLSHDVGIYRSAAERIGRDNDIARGMKPGLLPALQVWAYVQSLPEPGRAIIGMGKRDAAFDAGLPVPARHYRPGAPSPTQASSAWEITAMMDQHAFMRINDGDDIQVGDMIAFDISHPCLTFDKWKQVLLVNDDYRVVDIAQTFF